MNGYNTYLKNFGQGMPSPRIDVPRDIDPSITIDGGAMRDRQEEIDLINKFSKTAGFNIDALNRKRREFQSRAEWLVYLRGLLAAGGGSGQYWDEKRRMWVDPAQPRGPWVGTNPPVGAGPGPVVGFRK